MSKVVVFLEWSTKGRDFEMDFPLMYFFKKKLGWEVRYISIFNLPKLLNIDPDIVVMSNTTGAIENVKISELIHKANIPLFSNVSEGMFRQNDLDAFIWGWNREKKFLQKNVMLWGNKAYLMSISKYPYLKDKVKISGSTGHDRYTIEKDDLTENKVIGYASFPFNNIYKSIEKRIPYMVKRFGGKNLKHLQKLEKKVNEILLKIIEDKDITLVVKPHPADGKKLPLELQGLQNRNNVEFVSGEESVSQVISRSDIWISVNSTTNLEAWLKNKVSISLETYEDIYLSDTLYGSIISQEINKIQNYIDEFYNTGKIQAFEEKKELREKLISDYIGFADGFNHIRFMSFLKPYVEKIENGELEKGKWNIPFKIKLKGYIRHFLYSLSKGKYNTPLLKRWARPYDIFDDEQVEEQKKLRYPDFDKFYAENQEQIDHIYQTWHKNWKSELGIKE